MYDGDLIHCLEMVNPNENNFVVLHLLSIFVITKLQQRMEDMDREKRKEEGVENKKLLK